MAGVRRRLCLRRRPFASRSSSSGAVPRCTRRPARPPAPSSVRSSSVYAGLGGAAGPGRGDHGEQPGRRLLDGTCARRAPRITPRSFLDELYRGLDQLPRASRTASVAVRRASRPPAASASQLRIVTPSIPRLTCENTGVDRPGTGWRPRRPRPHIVDAATAVRTWSCLNNSSAVVAVVISPRQRGTGSHRCGRGGSRQPARRGLRRPPDVAPAGVDLAQVQQQPFELHVGRACRKRHPGRGPEHASQDRSSLDRREALGRCRQNRTRYRRRVPAGTPS